MKIQKEVAARNLLFHPFRILVTLGPGKEGVHLLTQPIFVRYFSRFTTLEHFNVVDATYASIFTRAANNGAGMFVTFFYRVPMLKLNDVHLIDCAFR